MSCKKLWIEMCSLCLSNAQNVGIKVSRPLWVVITAQRALIVRVII